MNEFKKKLTGSERKLADKVADEILTVKVKEERRYFFLILLFLICFIFLVSSLSFAVFSTYYNGTENNLIDVEIDFDDDDKDEDKDKDKDEDKDEDDKHEKPGIILFSFNSGSNYIDMRDVLPTRDEIGKTFTGNKEYFDFNVSTTIKNKNSGIMYYEISLVPSYDNTISQEDVRVYLTENGKAVSMSDDVVLNFSDLPESKYHEGGRVIYRSNVKKSTSVDYIFRMWLSSDAEVDNVSRVFGCKVMVDAYYR